MILMITTTFKKVTIKMVIKILMEIIRIRVKLNPSLKMLSE